MKIIGCDLHAAQQTIAMLDRETGEIVEKTLKHEAGTVREYLRLGIVLELSPPVFLLATLFGVKGVGFAVKTEFGAGSYESKFDRDLVHLPDVVFESLDADVHRALRPMLDGLWQAAGRQRCDLYEDDSGTGS